MLCFTSLPLCSILKKFQSFFYILPSNTFKKIFFVMSFKQTDELKITEFFDFKSLNSLKTYYSKSVIDFICFFVYFKVGRIWKHFLLTFGILLRCTPEMCFFSEIEILKKNSGNWTRSLSSSICLEEKLVCSYLNLKEEILVWTHLIAFVVLISHSKRKSCLTQFSCILFNVWKIKENWCLWLELCCPWYWQTIN